LKSTWLWLLSQQARRIWFRASLFSVLAVITALIAIVVSPYIPSDLPTKIGADAVDNILGIIASSMLAVTTFSLSTMVSAFTAATSNVTPRATKLVMEDSTTQNVLATFIGSFLFSLVGIIALSTGAYGEQGRLVLFLVTIAVIVLIVVTLLRWIDHLTRLGRVTETTERVEDATIDAMRARRHQPYLGGSPLSSHDDVPKIARPIHTSAIGYVQHIDTAALSRIAEAGEGQVFLNMLPGKLVEPTTPIAWSTGLDEEGIEQRIRACFTIGDTRSFDQDPRFGAAVLAEIASRALSPAVNDPGTAIDVIGRSLRILAVWLEPRDRDGDDGVLFPKIHVPGIELDDIFDDLFRPIARDGAGIVEVGIRLQKAFQILARFDQGRYAANARRHSEEALKRAEIVLPLEEDRTVLRDLSAAVRSVNQ